MGTQSFTQQGSPSSQEDRPSDHFTKQTCAQVPGYAAFPLSGEEKRAPTFLEKRIWVESPASSTGAQCRRTSLS